MNDGILLKSITHPPGPKSRRRIKPSSLEMIEINVKMTLPQLYDMRRRLTQLADTFISIDPETGYDVFERLEEVNREIEGALK